MAPVPVIQKTDNNLTAPILLCEHLKQAYNLEILDYPVEISSIKAFQVWHQIVPNDPL